jgi:small subunit ribosomal protein S21
MKLARWRHAMAEEAAEVPEAAAANAGKMAHIQIHDGESIENALRRFKRKVLQEDIIKESKKHAFYLKPGEKKRVKQALARKRARKKIRRQPTEDR